MGTLTPLPSTSTLTPIEPVLANTLTPIEPEPYDDGIGTPIAEMSKAGRFGRAVATDLGASVLATAPAIGMIAGAAFDTITGDGYSQDKGALENFGINMQKDSDGNLRTTADLMHRAVAKGEEWGDISYAEMTGAEELAAAIGTAILPIGLLGKTATGARLATKATSALSALPKAVQIPTKIMARAAELTVIPGTIPTTVLNTGANAIIAGGITEIMREATRGDSYTDTFGIMSKEQASVVGPSSTKLPIYTDPVDNVSEGMNTNEIAGATGATIGGITLLGLLSGRVGPASKLIPASLKEVGA